MSLCKITQERLQKLSSSHQDAPLILSAHQLITSTRHFQKEFLCLSNTLLLL